MKKKLALVLAMMVVTGALAACSGSAAPAASSSAPAEASSEAAAEESSSEEASTEEAGEAEDQTGETAESGAVADAAMAYFANFPKTPAYNNNAISTADLMALMDAEEDMMILDIRQAEDYEAGHLRGAVNVPYQNIPQFLTQIPDDVPVFVNCYTGQTSSQTVALLNMAGKYAVNIQSGWNRGISKTEGYEAYTDTEAVDMPEGDYPVDEEIAQAITEYYAEADGHNYKYFNFPVADLMELVDAESDQYTILSVRQAADYETGHIAGAINIPFGKDMQASFGDIPTDKPVVVYCYTGQTASQVMAVLRMLGFEAYNLNGGMGNENFGWLSEGGEVVTE